MEAKDTVMDIHIRQELAVGWVCNPFNDTPIELIKNTILDTAQIQAEISFKAGQESVREKWNDAMDLGLREAYRAGIKEVVDWIKATRVGGYNLCLKVNWDEWQAKLKEWHIETD